MIVLTKILTRLYQLIFVLVVTTTLYLVRCEMDNNIEYDPDAHENSELILNLKYILLWTDPLRGPLTHLESESQAFIKRNCTFKNCYIYPNRLLFKDKSITQVDAIVFHGPDIEIYDLPEQRSPHQKYIFVAKDQYYRVCHKKLNNFFNLTWTFKLHSDIELGHLSIWDRKRRVIGPKKMMHWMNVEQMKCSINSDVKNKLKRKKIAVAWFESKEKSWSKREKIAAQLKIELKKRNLDLRILRNCSTKGYPRIANMTKCLKRLKRYYYFYLSFEDVVAEDYVTEELLMALQNYVVPIVYGGANYTRFMPDGIYLDAKKASPAELADQIAALIKDKEKYYSYFKWRNHYSYHDVKDSPESDPYCRLCAELNENDGKRSTYPNMIKWWNARQCLEITS